MPRSSTRDEEFTAFMQRSGPSLLRTAWLLTGDEHLAADLVQNACVKTYLAWSRVRPETATAYARRAVVTSSIDAHRRVRREVVVPEPGDRLTFDDSADAVAERDRVSRMLDTLPPRQRAVLVLRFYEDLSERETADQLGISVGTVKSAASRGLNALRNHLVRTPEEAQS